MRRALLLLVLLALAAAAPARADDPAQTEPVVADGVTIAGVDVGGLTRDGATAAVQAAFGQPLRFTFRTRRWKATPEQLGARAYVDGAVRRALVAAPGEDVDLVVAVKGAAVRRYVAYLDRTFSRPAQDSTLRLRRLRPYLTKSRRGVQVERNPMVAAVVRALVRSERDAIPLAFDVLQPARTISNWGPVIVIRRGSKHLYLYNGMRYWKRFPVATGRPAYPTPLGRFAIVVKERNPWWYPPDADWAKGEEPIPPGPGNPLGTRWMGLSAPGVGIHGTPDAASVGYSASHGCIRMLIPDAEWLFDHVYVGTVVFIVSA